MDPLTFGRSKLQQWFKTDGFDKNLRDNVELEEMEKGRAVFSMRVSKGLTNMSGNLHGGAIATIVDDLTSVALLTTSTNPGVTIELSVSYKRAAPLNTRMRVVCTVLKVGKNLAFLEAELYDDKERLVAKGKHTKYLTDLTAQQRAKL